MKSDLSGFPFCCFVSCEADGEFWCSLLFFVVISMDLNGFGLLAYVGKRRLSINGRQALFNDTPILCGL